MLLASFWMKPKRGVFGSANGHDTDIEQLLLPVRAMEIAERLGLELRGHIDSNTDTGLTHAFFQGTSGDPIQSGARVTDMT
jgi:hypothetical protein